MKFQYVLLTIFGVAGVAAVICFAKCPVEQKNAELPSNVKGNVVIWGTYPLNADFARVINDFNTAYQDSFSVSYQFHDPKTFDTVIVEALSADRGPDVLLLPDDLILRHTDKIELIPYASVPPAVFSNTFIQAAEIYMRDQGLVALPFAIDPLVMYWNRDLFNNASLTIPPKFWDEFLTMTPKLTNRNPKTSDIEQSAIAFGEFVNLDHAKDILAMLFLQVGNPIVKVTNGKPMVMIATESGNEVVPDENVVSVMRFFMDFSNPVKNIYTWNRSKSGSLNEFINGNLAVHFDYASRYDEIKDKNPHLNFAVAQVPLPRNTKVETTFAKVHGFAVLKKSWNKPTAFIATQKLLFDANPAKDFAAAFNLPPVRRDLLAVPQTDAALSVFYDAAIRAKTWLDPKPAESTAAFAEGVNAISSGLTNSSGGVAIMHNLLLPLIQPYQY
jgi:ABC-type glycerol-3-phosphate transport system substrate-binding protein